MKRILSKTSFLKCLPPEELERLAAVLTEERYGDGDLIFSEGDNGDCFYIIKEGKIELTKRSSLIGHNYQSAELRVLETYDFFGEMALIDDYPRSATAKAVGKTVLLKLVKNDFLELCYQYPDVLYAISAILAERLRYTNDRYAQLWDSLIKKNKMAALGSAANKIVHDIKTPITINVLSAQLCEKLHPETARFTQQIIMQTKVIDELVREILEFARNENSSLKLEELSLVSLLEDIVKEFSLLAEEQNIKIMGNYKFDEIISLDRSRFGRVIRNIIKNSIDAMGNNGTINISTARRRNKIIIEIRDSGPGIIPEIIHALFEPFVTRGKKGGTGLGLAIGKKIVEEHGGEITARNHAKGGAIFEISLPCPQTKNSSKEI